MTELAAPDLEFRLEKHRTELTGYCFRMLGSGFEAEDAVQDTMLRAWKAYDSFEGRSALRSWLYRIATNVCFDMLAQRQRRARPMDLGPCSMADSALAPPSVEAAWVEPVPDARVLPSGGDPAELAIARESVRLAFVAAARAPGAGARGSRRSRPARAPRSRSGGPTATAASSPGRSTSWRSTTGGSWG